MCLVFLKLTIDVNRRETRSEFNTLFLLVPIKRINAEGTNLCIVSHENEYHAVNLNDQFSGRIVGEKSQNIEFESHKSHTT